jgi:hypothetical protein
VEKIHRPFQRNMVFHCSQPISRHQTSPGKTEGQTHHLSGQKITDPAVRISHFVWNLILKKKIKRKRGVCGYT